jgi:hypothetical protein
MHTLHIPRNERKKKTCEHPTYAVMVKTSNKITGIPESGRCRLCGSEVTIKWVTELRYY